METASLHAAFARDRVMPRPSLSITAVEDLHADAGWRDFSFLKVTAVQTTRTSSATVEKVQLVGWAEYMEGNGPTPVGCTAMIRAYATTNLLGRDPREFEKLSAELKASAVQVHGGVAAQAAAAIENALLDLASKSAGLPVADLLGGAVRTKLPVYWTQTGNCRLDRGWNVGGGPNSGKPPLRSTKDIEALGEEAVRMGFSSLKSNIFHFDEGPSFM